MATIKEIEEIWNSRQPIIWVNTFEERRVIEEIVHSPIVGITKETGDKVGKVNARKKLYIWSCTQGLVEIKGDQFQNFDTLKAQDLQTLQPALRYGTEYLWHEETYQGFISSYSLSDLGL